MEALVYIPMDRRQALAGQMVLPERLSGAALFADISGFTPLTEALARDLGPQRGAEELTRHLNIVYDALIQELHRFSGSVIGFSGDAITCWFNGDNGLRATTCALGMQQAMRHFANVSIPGDKTISLAMKAAVTIGNVRRFIVGDPQIQVMDAMAGSVIDQLALAEHHAGRGEVLVDWSTASRLGELVDVAEWRRDTHSDQRFGVVERVTVAVPECPWPPIPPDAIPEEQVKLWLLQPVYDRLNQGQGDFLAELRPAAALFLRFGGIDYDQDVWAGEKLDQFIRQVQAICVKYEGTLLQLTIGDKGSYLYAAFGAPIAHEDDAVRAVSVALDVRRAAAALDFITELQIGLSQGRLRAGAYGGQTRRTYGVHGDIVNLAARLMQGAGQWQILASAPIYNATSGAFRWEEQPPLRVKGKSEPVAVYSLLAARERHAVHLQEPKYAIPMVGRVKELTNIEEKLRLAIKGAGQVVGISGEAGIGKSRLIAEVIRLANQDGLLTYGSECQSYGTNTSYLVWQGIWQSFFDLDPNWRLDEKLAALKNQVEEIDPLLVSRLPLLSPLVNVNIPDNDLTASMDGKLRKESLESMLADILRQRARSNPILFVLENCHWLDPLSYDLLEAIGKAIGDRPVCIVMAYRPTDLPRIQTPRLNELDWFFEINLTEFSQEEAALLIRMKLEQFFGEQQQLSPAFVENITRRAQGNPFYIEELINYLQDRGLNPKDIGAVEQLELPTSLHSLILTRIDQRTESQKITLKLASIIGRLFVASWLWGAFPPLEEHQQVIADLDVLSRLDLTPLDATEPELTYLFKHIVTQEVAYESLPFAMRARFHDLLAQYVEEKFSGLLDQYVDLLAYHYNLSQNEAKKKEYLLKAGESAQAKYANEAAIAYYQQALPLLADDEKVPIMLMLGQVLVIVGRWQDADHLYQKALAVANATEDQKSQAGCQLAIGEMLRKRGQFADALSWFNRARSGFIQLNDQEGLGKVLHSLGTLYAQQGDYPSATRYYEQSMDIRLSLGDQINIANLLNNLGILARYAGELEKARQLQEQSLSIRRSLGNRAGIAVSLNNLSMLAHYQGDDVTAITFLEEALLIFRELGSKWETATCLSGLGELALKQGDVHAATNYLRESMQINKALGDRRAIAYLLEYFAGLASLQFQPHRAVCLVGAASALRQEIGAPLSPTELIKLDELMERAHSELNEIEQATAFGEGRGMNMEAAINYAMETHSNENSVSG